MRERRIITVFGEEIEVLVSSKSSKYTCCVCVQTSPPGGGPPPHKHEREEEVFMVLDGDFEFFDGSGWSPMRIGEAKCSIRGSYHAFRNCGDTDGRILFMTNTGGIDEYFEKISPLAIPKDLATLTEIGGDYGYVFLPPE